MCPGRGQSTALRDKDVPVVLSMLIMMLCCLLNLKTTAGADDTSKQNLAVKEVTLTSDELLFCHNSVSDFIKLYIITYTLIIHCLTERTHYL